MKETKDYYIDENYNKWDKDKFTLEEAKEYSESIINRYGCVERRNYEKYAPSYPYINRK